MKPMNYSQIRGVHPVRLDSGNNCLDGQVIHLAAADVAVAARGFTVEN
jgi:hypothetical protein